MHRAFLPRPPVRHHQFVGRILAVRMLYGLMLCVTGPALATDPPVVSQSPTTQAPTTQPPTAPPPAAQPPSTSGDLARSAEELARSAGEVARSVGGALGSLWNDVTGRIIPGAPTDHLPGQISEEDKQLFLILETIGLRLQDVTVGKGMMSSASYRFVATREPTGSDIAKAEDLLRLYRDSADSLRSRAKQRIARSALDTVSTAGFTLSAVDITLSPWPDASYQITAKPSAEATQPAKP